MDRTQRLDGWRTHRLAAAVPLLCAVHCLAAPLAVTLAPALALPAATEPVVQAATLLFATWLALRGLRVHGRAAVFVPMAIGVVLWAVALTLGGRAAAFEPGLVAAGSLAIASGLWWNARLRHHAACPDCGCGAHAHE